MKFTILASAALPLLLAQRAVATWGNANAFSCPTNTDNQCSQDQKSGYDWSKAQLGSISSYDQFSISGFVCASEFRPGAPGRKRSLQVRSDFNKKCIQGKAPKASGDGPNKNSPKISCNQDRKMSITNMQVSVDQDTDLDFHYDMPDGSICKKTQHCKATGSVVTNDQCGGAKSVRVQVNKKGKSDCEFGIHKIEFDCNPAVGKPPSTTTTEKKTTKTTEKTSEKTTHKTTDKTSEKTSKKTSEKTYDKTSDKTYDKTTMMTYEKTTTEKETKTKTKTTKEIPQYTPPSIYMPPENMTTYEMKTTTLKCETCYESKTTEMYMTTPPMYVPPVMTTPPMYQPPVMTTSMYNAPPMSDTPPPSNAPCPEVLPRCLNTWMMKIPACKSNSDITCFCPQPEYIQKVQDCVAAWGGSDSELQGAYSYLVGICAKYVPQNPGLCTNVPTSISLVANPTPPPQTVYNTMGSMVETTTIPMTMSMTPPPPEQCTTITWSAEGPSGVMSSGTVTVPQVAFTTGAGTAYTTMDSNGQPMVTTSDAGVGLVPFLAESTSPGAPFPTGANNMTAGLPTPTPAPSAPIGEFKGGAVGINANIAAAGLFAVAAFLV